MSSMTLEQVRDWHRKQAYACGLSQSRQDEGMHHDLMADAINAHITQPHAVPDVDACRYVNFRRHACEADWDQKQRIGHLFACQLDGIEHPTNEQFDNAFDKAMRAASPTPETKA